MPSSLEGKNVCVCVNVRNLCEWNCRIGCAMLYDIAREPHNCKRATMIKHRPCDLEGKKYILVTCRT